MKNKIKKWEKITKEITEQFLLDYFEDDSPDYYYVANEVGGVFCYADYWFSFSDVLKCYELGITKEQLIEWYDFCLENQTVNISLAKYILSPQEREEQHKKHLAELKERVRVAEEELKKAIEEHK
jgi:hypothetical protein